MTIDCHGLTDVGRVRERNEDQFLIAELTRGLTVHGSSLSEADQRRLRPLRAQLFAVADGVGGAARGDRASRLAIRTLASYFLDILSWCRETGGEENDALLNELSRALQRCEERLRVEILAGEDEKPMATTLTLALVVWPRLWVGHVGDSRCYLLRGGELSLLTKDHTVAQQLRDQGTITESGMHRSPWRNVLWNSLGGSGSEFEPELASHELEFGDALLLCSDGLSGFVPEDELRAALARDDVSAEDTCHALVEQANENGGKDNITCVVARFRDLEPQAQRLADPDTASLTAAAIAPREGSA
ncbi:MAG: PP2C family serine/threonine-protein phosphatase [Planctomycetota bacterium]